MNDIVGQAVSSVQNSKNSFCKFISANECGNNGAHQEGFYIPKNSISLFIDRPAIRGTNIDKNIIIKWQNDFITNSRFIYYGKGTRNEYRLTRFGRGFPLLQDDSVGDLFILSHIEGEYYEAFVLSADDDIEEFFAEFNLTSGHTNRLIEKSIIVKAEDNLLECFNAFNKILESGFPNTTDLSATARNCYNSSFKITDQFVKSNPDKILLKWLDSEYQLFKLIELGVYSEMIKTPFKTVDELIQIANTILNRRKSRAGKSLEHHLAEIFTKSGIFFSAQAKTEDNKKPDFIFPNRNNYHDGSFDSNKLTFLAAKTTCKDRWRQVINEADRIEIKHLFTLQQGISKNQLKEMYKEGVKLVVPEPYLKSFPEEYQSQIFTLQNFVSHTSSIQ